MEFFDHAWAVWIIAAVIAAIFEMIVPSFSFSFASIGAMVAALASMQFGWQIQAIIFAATTVISMALLRTRLLRTFLVKNTQGVSKVGSRTDSLIGAHAEVTEAIDVARNMGRVTVDGQDWAAKSDRPIAIGQRVTVHKSDGIFLIVKEENQENIREN